MEFGLGRKGEITLECPFCKEGKIKVFHKEGFLQPKVSRISAGAKVTYHGVPDEYEVLEACPNCGRSRKQIQRAFETGETREVPHEERVERLKKAGLPTELEF